MEENHLLECKQFILKLHQLYLKGKNDTDEADEIRDEMEPHWYKLTEEEIKEADRYSADLYEEDDKN